MHLPTRTLTPALAVMLALSVAGPARAAAASAPALAAAPIAAAVEARPLDVDAVELVLHGTEVAGLPDLSLVRDGIAYHFASRENLVVFERDPQRFEVQLGGACARMGPLSGACSLDNRAVYAGRLYVFASPQCRASFLKAPERLLDATDPTPVVDKQSRERGQALLERTVQAVGGAAAIDAIRTCVESEEHTEDSGGTPARITNTTWLAFAPGGPRAMRMRRDSTWNDSLSSDIVADGRGAAVTGTERRPLVASQQRALEKELGRDPLVVLRNRLAPNIVVAHMGAGMLDGVPVELVDVALDGRTTELVIDPSTGMLLALRYRGRNEDATFANLEVRLSNWRQVGAVRLPFTRTVFADGVAQSGQSRTLDTIELDSRLDRDVFRTFR